MKTTLLIKLLLSVMGVTLLFDITLSGDNITSIATAICSLLGLIITLKIKNRQTILQTVLTTAVEKVDTKVEGYHKEVDGKMTSLVEAVKGRGEAEGFNAGKQQQAQDTKDATVPETKEIKAETIVVTTEQAAVKATNVIVAKENEKTE